MGRGLAFTRRWPAYLGLSVLAVAGQLVWNQAVATIGRSQGKPWSIFTPGFDFEPIWAPNWVFFHRAAKPWWYGAGLSNAWPPPHEVLLAPFGLLTYDAAHVVSMVLCAILMIGHIALWTRMSPRPATTGWGSGWPLLLSVPLLSVIWIDQLQAAIGLAGLSLAIWARNRDRWWLAGVFAAVGGIRVVNAIPIYCILLISAWRKPRQLATAAGAGALFMAPLLLISYDRDHRFVLDYIDGLTAYPANGAPKVAAESFGLWGVAMLLVLVSALAIWLVRKDAGRPLDPGRSALGMSLTVAIAPVGGLYPGIFALPALARLGQRPGFAAVAWIGAAVPWLAILTTAPWLFSAAPEAAVTALSGLNYALILLAYPLLRNPPEQAVPAELVA